MIIICLVVLQVILGVVLAGNETDDHCCEEETAILIGAKEQDGFGGGLFGRLRQPSLGWRRLNPHIKCGASRINAHAPAQ